MNTDLFERVLALHRNFLRAFRDNPGIEIQNLASVAGTDWELTPFELYDALTHARCPHLPIIWHCDTCGPNAIFGAQMAKLYERIGLDRESAHRLAVEATERQSKAWEAP